MFFRYLSRLCLASSLLFRSLFRGFVIDLYLFRVVGISFVLSLVCLSLFLLLFRAFSQSCVIVSFVSLFRSLVRSFCRSMPRSFVFSHTRIAKSFICPLPIFPSTCLNITFSTTAARIAVFAKTRRAEQELEQEQEHRHAEIDKPRPPARTARKANANTIFLLGARKRTRMPGSPPVSRKTKKNIFSWSS